MDMPSTNPCWVTQAAAQPVAFAQVREDPWLDERVFALHAGAASAFLVASGGCTACWLAGRGLARELLLVDVNPAQLALTRLKLALLQTHSPEERKRILGHAPLDPSVRKEALGSLLDGLSLAQDSLGQLEPVARLGPDHAGRYEMLFVALREALARRGWQAPAVEALLLGHERLRSGESRQNGSARWFPELDEAFDETMALENLVALFGEGATRNPALPFSRHFAERTRLALAREDAGANPYLWQVLLGRGSPAGGTPWLDLERCGTLPRVTSMVSTVHDALRRHTSTFDVVHLSNTLDWSTPEEAAATLQAAARALRPGGKVILRQLNSSLDLRRGDAGISWDPELSGQLLEADRSYFYRQVHVGLRP